MKFNSEIAMYIFFGIIFFYLGIILIIDGQYWISLFCWCVIAIMIRDVLKLNKIEKVNNGTYWKKFDGDWDGFDDE